MNTASAIQRSGGTSLYSAPCWAGVQQLVGRIQRGGRDITDLGRDAACPELVITASLKHLMQDVPMQINCTSGVIFEMRGVPERSEVSRQMLRRRGWMSNLVSATNLQRL